MFPTQCSTCSSNVPGCQGGSKVANCNPRSVIYDKGMEFPAFYDATTSTTDKFLSAAPFLEGTKEKKDLQELLL